MIMVINLVISLDSSFAFFPPQHQQQPIALTLLCARLKEAAAFSFGLKKQIGRQ